MIQQLFNTEIQLGEQILSAVWKYYLITYLTVIGIETIQFFIQKEILEGIVYAIIQFNLILLSRVVFEYVKTVLERNKKNDKLDEICEGIWKINQKLRKK